MRSGLACVVVALVLASGCSITGSDDADFSISHSRMAGVELGETRQQVDDTLGSALGERTRGLFRTVRYANGLTVLFLPKSGDPRVFMVSTNDPRYRTTEEHLSVGSSYSDASKNRDLNCGQMDFDRATCQTLAHGSGLAFVFERDKLIRITLVTRTY